MNEAKTRIQRVCMCIEKRINERQIFSGHVLTLTSYRFSFLSIIPFLFTCTLLKRTMTKDAYLPSAPTYPNRIMLIR